MLYLDGGERLGVPNFYLVETHDEQRLAFVNTYTNVTHSVIDFYSANVEPMLTGLRTRKVIMNGASGFFDPDVSVEGIYITFFMKIVLVISKRFIRRDLTMSQPRIYELYYVPSNKMLDLVSNLHSIAKEFMKTFDDLPQIAQKQLKLFWRLLWMP